MGCCFSSSRDNDNPAYAAQVATEERRRESSPHRAIATSNALSATNTSTSTRVARTSRSDPHSLSQHYNAPIRRHVWYSKRRMWSRAALDQERTAFFETRVTGRPEIWAALSAAVSLMRAGDIPTAQTIIDAAGITVPTGDLCQGCYDEQGALYRLPQCIVSDPENLVRSIQDQDDEFDTDDGRLSSDEASGDDLIANNVDLERRRDEKGKTSERDLIRVRARLSDRGGPDVDLSVGKTQNVGFVARKVQQEAGIPRTHRVKIVYLGKVLKEHEPLVDQGWNPSHVINALVVPRHVLS
ncbi:ubiquitin domain-containing protein [Aspergillus homomorphus CBS 101889]|uniref:Ubiquitin domain protein n=1 Tax=Aspergillus homomorphus (strain CBS 101889) TaxID=1450537 RepID=A0A395HUI8_ASPHC|nr:ubiquitin domain protein [Aspergillus homomorphus CBS 101889]RAL10498.1 ubiquitin domain protein [Aspergillus homomorphus CBS 101889]